MTTFYGIVHESVGRLERYMILSAPTLRAAKMKMRKTANVRGWQVKKLTCYELRGTHIFELRTMQRMPDGTAQAVDA